MAKPCRICVVGSANVDLTFRTPRLPRPGETLAGRAFHVGLGGKGANQAVAAARLGAEVTFVARVGSDAFGEDALRRYQADGVSTRFVQRDLSLPTGTAAILVDDAAENSIIVVPGANGAMTVEDVRAAAEAIQSADAVLCQLETPLEATLEAFRLARSAGRCTVLTPAPMRELPDALLELCDLCVPNKSEIEQLVGRSVNDLVEVAAAADLLRSCGVKRVAVTLGAEGALLLDETGPRHVPAIPVVAVDTTGAGDAFTAALAVRLAEGASFREAARQASAVAALTVSRLGAYESFPSTAEVRPYLVNSRP